MLKYIAGGLEAYPKSQQCDIWVTGMFFASSTRAMISVRYETDLSQFLFLEPNASDPLNKDAAEDLRMSREAFKRNVRNSMAGGYVRQEKFDRVVI